MLPNIIDVFEFVMNEKRQQNSMTALHHLLLVKPQILRHAEMVYFIPLTIPIKYTIIRYNS